MDETTTEEVEAKEESETPFVLNLRGQDIDGPITHDQQRFNFFLIDTGWNEGISKMVQKHFPKCSTSIILMTSSSS